MPFRLIRAWCLLLPPIVLFPAAAAAQETTGADEEPLAIVEVGAVPAWSLTGEGSTLSPTVALEFTPIEHWLEIEVGLTPTFNHGTHEWDTDFLFKKPWSLSKKLELMAGAGPEWLHLTKSGIATNAPAAEVALDFMYWPSAKRRFGLYFEPAYDHGFGAIREQSISLTAGLLIGIR